MFKKFQFNCDECSLCLCAFQWGSVSNDDWNTQINQLCCVLLVLHLHVYIMLHSTWSQIEIKNTFSFLTTHSWSWFDADGVQSLLSVFCLADVTKSSPLHSSFWSRLFLFLPDQIYIFQLETRSVDACFRHWIIKKMCMIWTRNYLVNWNKLLCFKCSVFIKADIF